ncbi:MAG: LCP family protein [Clostridia bacterium]
MENDEEKVEKKISKRRRSGAQTIEEKKVSVPNKEEKAHANEPSKSTAKPAADKIKTESMPSKKAANMQANNLDSPNVVNPNSKKTSVDKKKKKNKKPLTKKAKILLSITLVIYVAIFVSVCFAGTFLGKRYAQVDIEKIDSEDLGIEKNVFDESNLNISKNEFNQIKTLAIFGTDNRATSDENSRSDVNMVVSINPTTKSLKMISVPRDTHVQINGSKDKMAHAYFYGGPQLAVKTLNQNFGLNITEYVTIDFYGVINAINKIGGVELDITEAERNYINKWTEESYGFSGRKYEALTTSGPKTLLNGEQTLAHARNRSIGNDFTRAERQRSVFTAILNKLSTKSLSEVMDLVDLMLQEVKTNINVIEYTKYIPELFAAKDQYLANIISRQIPATEDLHFETINGLSCVVTDLNAQKVIFRDCIFNK